MCLYSLGFLALLGTGAFLTAELTELTVLSRGLSSVAVTTSVALPLAVWVWFGTIAPMRKSRGARG